MQQEFGYRTPESLVLSQPVAGIGSRGLAAVIDSVIILTIMLALVFGALGLNQVAPNLHAVGPLLIPVVVVASVVPILYYVVFEVATAGRSPGKLIFGLRVVDLQGVPVGLPDSLVRNLIRILDFLPLLYGIGVVAMFLGRRPRRLGDLAAGTVVVHDHGVRRLPDAAARAGPVPVSAADPGQPLPALEGCGRFELDLIGEFLRRPGLSRDRRGQLARELVSALGARAGARLDAEVPEEDPVHLLERSYLQLRQRLSGP
ncbi:MAG: RDD family protein [Candidatus Dormibacteria bacterium]